MNYKYPLLILLFAKSLNSQAQSTYLKITDSSRSFIELAYVKFYCNKSNDQISSYHIVRKSHFVIPAGNNCNNVKIEISAPGYQDYYRDIKISDFLNDTLLCVLSKINVKNLQPVVVTGKSRPIQIKNDTTTYKVKAFSDGTEQKLIDILEKLPGIEVNKKSGEIKFKGKPIETILLEGDNLFGANYTLATKNINAGIVTEVQAIENYSENYVLKGLEQEEKVALNIKVAKTKMNIPGNTEIGLGIQGNTPETSSDINTNMIGLGQKYKFFSTASYNNTGYNKSPVDYFGNNFSIEQLKDRKYAAQKFIYDPFFAVGNGNNYSNINSQFFGNYNALFKIVPKITLKGNIYYVNDKISNQQNFVNEYFLTNDTITTNDLTTGQKKPQSIKGNFNFRYAISSKALLEASFSDTRDEIKSYRSSKSNFIPVYQSNLFSDERFNKFLTTYTQRIYKSQVLQVELRSIKNNIGQIYNVYPSVFKRNLFTQDKQTSNFERTYTHLTATLFGKVNKTVYNFYIKGISDKNNYISSIINNDTNLNIVSNSNDVKYLKPSIAQGGNFNFNFGKLKITTLYNMTFLQQQWLNISNGSELSKKSFLFEPSVRLKYVLTNISTLFLNYNYNYKNTNDQYLFPEIIIQNFRNATNNKIDLSLIKTNTITLNYSRSDPYNQFDNGIGITFQTNGRDYLPTYNITDTLVYTTFSMETVNNETLDIYLYIKKYIAVIKSSLNLSLNNTTNYYNNFLLPGLIRRNISNSSTATLFFKTIFKGKFNFETENTLSLISSKSTFDKLISNLSYFSTAKFIFIPNKMIKMFIVGDYLLPNSNTGKANLFLNYNLSFKPSKKNMEVKLIATNLTNTLYFFQYQVSDFSRSFFRTNTLPRNLVFYFSFQF